MSFLHNFDNPPCKLKHFTRKALVYHRVRAVIGVLPRSSRQFQRFSQFVFCIARQGHIIHDKINELFRDWDILLAPATPVAAPVIGTDFLDINGTRMPCRPSVGLLTQPISFMGCPVVAAPMWPQTTNGLPIGVQIIAAPWREDLALRAAWMLQQSGIAHTKPAAL